MAEASRITNHFTNRMPLPRLHVDRATVFAPIGPKDWTFSHQPHIASFQGKLVACWSTALIDEDGPGQRVVLSTSDDFHHWTIPVPVVDTAMGKTSELVWTAVGFHVHGDTLTAYIGRYEYEDGNYRRDRRLDMGLAAYTTKDGLSWEGPYDFGIPANPNHGPQRTSSGRLIIAGHVMFPYTDDPAGLVGWKASGLFPAAMEAGLKDCFHSAGRLAEALDWPVHFTEGSLHETDDGLLHMMLRTSGRRIWASQSRDDGATWSKPAETGFTDNNSRFHFGRLPDGRYYYVGNPDPDPSYIRRRLVLSLSEDGYSFDRHYELIEGEREPLYAGTHKGGTYAYPHTVIHDDALVIVHSVSKENIGVLRVPLRQLG
ncbi:exo-alpha-sialidase [Paenibacillus cymbidii]|uniref:exo-alpha-sialidase n=1 Tax=Paenibacillus cymbidii TaxID=1639034 RepID=UPI001436C67D|nr:exo-alpha-sialidase [Paenibacillus cymbidii]